MTKHDFRLSKTLVGARAKILDQQSTIHALQKELGEAYDWGRDQKRRADFWTAPGLCFLILCVGTTPLLVNWLFSK